MHLYLSVLRRAALLVGLTVGLCLTPALAGDTAITLHNADAAHLLGRAGLACGRVRGRVDAGVRMHRLGGEGADGPQTYRLVAPRLDEDDDA